MNICFTGMQFTSALKYNIGLKSINALVLFIINILFVRIAGPGISGDFFYMITLLSFITLLIGFSLDSGITFYASAQTANTGSLAWFILLVSIIQMGFSYFIIAVAFTNTTALPPIYLLMFVISNILISNFSGLYFARSWFASLNIIFLGVNITALVALFILFTWLHNTAIIYAEKIYILSFFIQAAGLITLFFIKSKIYNFHMPSAGLLKSVLKFSLIALAGNLAFFLVTRIDYFFVKKYCTAEALGNYIQVSKIAQMFVLIPAMAASVIMPFTAGSSQNILPKVQWLCRLTAMLVTVAASIFIIAGKWFFPLIFGEKFDLMYVAMLYYLPGILALCISALLASHIGGKGFISVNVIASVIALVIVIIGDTIFIPRYGINAAAAISSLAYLSCMFYLLHHLSKKYNARPASFFIFHFAEIKFFFLSLINKFKAN